MEDVDIVADRERPEAAAPRVAAQADAHLFPLSERFGAWRVIARDRTWQATSRLCAALDRGRPALRDFTINAMARPLDGPGELLDPHGGQRGPGAGSVLRAVGARTFEDDPLRVLRLARFACELGFEVDPGTTALARRAAPRIAQVAPERSFYELRRLICAPDPVAGIRRAGDAGLLPHLLPELDGSAESSRTRTTTSTCGATRSRCSTASLEVERDPGAVFGELGEAHRRRAGRPLADELTRGEALRFGALLHDAGKPATRAVSPEGASCSGATTAWVRR